MDKPYLTLVDPTTDPIHDQEFAPLPYYPWDERPQTLQLEADEVATALHLANGDLQAAADLLKVPLVKINRALRSHPRLKVVQTEALEVALAKAASIPIRTLFNPNADQRALEWASTKLLQSRLAIGHPLSPAPPQPGVAASMTLQQANRSITFRWRTDADPLPGSDDDPS